MSCFNATEEALSIIDSLKLCILKQDQCIKNKTAENESLRHRVEVLERENKELFDQLQILRGLPAENEDKSCQKPGSRHIRYVNRYTLWKNMFSIGFKHQNRSLTWTGTHTRRTVHTLHVKRYQFYSHKLTTTIFLCISFLSALRKSFPCTVIFVWVWAEQ